MDEKAKLNAAQLKVVSECEEERVKIAATRIMKGLIELNDSKNNKETEETNIKIVRNGIKDEIFASFTALFEWTPHKKEEKCPMDSTQVILLL